jgi:hypothetical protein
MLSPQVEVDISLGSSTLAAHHWRFFHKRSDGIHPHTTTLNFRQDTSTLILACFTELVGPQLVKNYRTCHTLQGIAMYCKRSQARSPLPYASLLLPTRLGCRRRRSNPTTCIIRYVDNAYHWRQQHATHATVSRQRLLPALTTYYPPMLQHVNSMYHWRRRYTTNPCIDSKANYLTKINYFVRACFGRPKDEVGHRWNPSNDY